MASSKDDSKKLLSDYCHINEDGDSLVRLSDLERLTLVGGQELSKLIRKLSKEDSTLPFQSIFSSMDQHKIDSAYEFVSNSKYSFDTPKEIIQPKIIPVHGLSTDGDIVDIEFKSAYKPVHESYSIIQNTVAENQTVRCRLWRHAQTKAPTIVAVHGWTMGDPRINSLSFLPGLFFRLGFDIALFELPFHGRRLNSDFKDAGHSLFPSANLILTNEAMYQSVSDLRQLRLVLKALGVKKIGALGLSLGAYLSAFWSTLDELSFAVLMLPFFSFAELANFHLKKSGIDSFELQKILKVFKAHSLEGRTSKVDDSLVIATHSDVVIPAEQTVKVQEFYNNPKMVWLDGGHEINSSHDQVFDQTVSFLKPFL